MKWRVMLSNSRGGVTVYLRGTGLRSTCSVLHQVQVCCVSGGQVVSLKIRSRSISTTPAREITPHSGLSALTFITWRDNKTRLLWTKGVPFPCTIPASRVESFYIDDTAAPPPSDNRRKGCRLSSLLVQDPLGKCWSREYTASDMKFWCPAVALMTSPCPCSPVYPAVILSSERKFPLPSVLVVSVKKSKISISTLAK